VNPPSWFTPPKRWQWLKRLGITLLVLLLIVSVLINLDLGLLLFMRGAEGLQTTVLAKGDDDKIVAVYRVDGLIDDAAARQFARFHRAVRDNKNIKAIVLRVDSGGGSVSASDEIHQMVASLAQRVPVVVSMGGVAASGGYYISAPARVIYAQPTTATGSIGVIAAWPVVKGAMDRIGVEVVTLRSDRARQWKMRENLWEPPDAAIRQEVIDMLNAMQDRFEQVVREGRGGRLQTPATAPSDGQTGPAPFNGKVYLGPQAKDLGLVDEIGYFDQAVKTAAAEAGLGDKAKIVQYGAPKPLFEMLTGATSPGVNIDAKLVHELTSPQLLMVWKLD
jgi:protease-4